LTATRAAPLLLVLVLSLTPAVSASGTEKVAPRLVAATVGLVPVNPGEKAEVGSGVIVQADGLILTAAHVLEAPRRAFHVRLSDGRWARAIALGVCRERDIGMARIVGKGPWPFLSPAEGLPSREALVLAAGHPGGIEAGRAPPVRSGRVLESGRDGLRTTCALVSGDSGGPLVDLEGRAVGIHTSLDPTRREASHAPISDFKRHWHRLALGEVVKDTPPKHSATPSVGPETGKLLLRLVDGDPEAWHKADALLPGPKMRKALRRLLANAQRSESGQLTLQAGDPDGLQALAILITRALGRLKRAVPQAPEAVRAAPGTVEILVAGKPVALGTVVRADGRIVAKSSVVPDAAEVRIGARRLAARVVARRPVDDIALLEVDVRDLVPVKWASDEPALGTRVYVVGSAGTVLGLGVVGAAAASIPSDFELLLAPGKSVRRAADAKDGAVAAVRAISRMTGGTSARRRGFPSALRHDARLPATACGGPLLDEQGRAVAVNIAAHDLTCALAIPASRIRALFR
jgi:S1-C subfamily serine protease